MNPVEAASSPSITNQNLCPIYLGRSVREIFQTATCSQFSIVQCKSGDMICGPPRPMLAQPHELSQRAVDIAALERSGYGRISVQKPAASF